MRQSLKWLSIILSVVFLLGCSKYTQENFDKVQNGMAKQDVISILGEPTSSASMDIRGFSGTTAEWKDKDAKISIQFLNDKVELKTYAHAGESGFDKKD